MAKRHFKTRHFLARHFATKLLAGLDEDLQKPTPGPGSRAKFDRSRSKRIGVFPDLQRVRLKKKRDEDLLLFPF